MEFVGEIYPGIIQDVANPTKQTLIPVLNTMTMRYNSRLEARTEYICTAPAAAPARQMRSRTGVYGVSGDSNAMVNE
jgi:hypothetical protein